MADTTLPAFLRTFTYPLFLWMKFKKFEGMLEFALKIWHYLEYFTILAIIFLAFHTFFITIFNFFTPIAFGLYFLRKKSQLMLFLERLFLFSIHLWSDGNFTSHLTMKLQIFHILNRLKKGRIVDETIFTYSKVTYKVII